MKKENECPSSSMVEHRFCKPEVVGSSPSGGTVDSKNKCGFCGNINFSSQFIKNGILLKKCIECGVLMQILNMSSEEYNKWYLNYDDFIKNRGDKPYVDRYEHDYVVSEIRFKKYVEILDFMMKPPCLDIGCANGSFIDYLNSKNFFSIGLDIRKIYKGKNPFYQYNLCNDSDYIIFKNKIKKDFNITHFNIITMHDVFEHILEANLFMERVLSLLCNNGILIIDVPDYFNNNGVHHWRPIEHVYYFDKTYLENYFYKKRLKILKIDFPIKGKIVFYLQK